ncbi:MAG: hypothetical protein M9894_27155 [Planctomycetes bacterium]|nr:hypothetical protein [Planctomycetota bacterium]
MRRTAAHLTILTALALTGCDDVLLFDVDARGRVLAPIDGQGRVTAIGDGSRPRHLVALDLETGEAERLTTTPMPVSWPRWCGDAVTVVEARTSLMLLSPDGARRRLFETDPKQRLLQPTPSPSGERVAVLEVEEPGRPGVLHVVEVASGAAGEPLDGVVPGFAWVRDGEGEALLVARLGREAEGAQPFEGGQGEVLLVRDGARRTLFRGVIAGVTWFAAAGAEVVAVLPAPGDPQAIGLARLSLERPGAAAGERADGLDLWPTADARGQVLFTRSRPGRATLEGELRLARADALAPSRRVPTPGPVCAPRWAGARVAYLTPDDRLISQELDGGGVVDWTERLAALTGDHE